MVRKVPLRNHRVRVFIDIRIFEFIEFRIPKKNKYLESRPPPSPSPYLLISQKQGFRIAHLGFPNSPRLALHVLFFNHFSTRVSFLFLSFFPNPYYLLFVLLSYHALFCPFSQTLTIYFLSFFTVPCPFFVPFPDSYDVLFFCVFGTPNMGFRSLTPFSGSYTPN